jgi:hypothetical protein
MITDQNRLYDGWLTLEGGVDAGRLPDTIEVNQCQSAINMTFRGGSISTRPGWRKLEEEFPVMVGPAPHHDLNLDSQEWVYNHSFVSQLVNRIQGEYVDHTKEGVPAVPLPDPPYFFVPQNLENGNSEYVYRHGILQSAVCFNPHNGEDCIMAMIGGRLFRIIPGVDSCKVREVVIKGEGRDLRNQNNLPLAYMIQADKWMIAQDGSSLPIIYDGNIARRSRTTGTVDETEIPVGTIMAYGMGRIVVIVNDRNVAFGDLYGSHDGNPGDSIILFTERNFLAEGFDAAIPFQQGSATGAIFFPQLDTSTGNGQLMVFAERGAASFFVSIPRDQWKTSAFQVLSLLTTGLRGHRSISVVNEDLWFRSDDGVRSYRQARSEPSGWAHIPLSTNVRQYLENDASGMLKYCSSIYFDNRIIMTTSPVWSNGRPWHFGFVVVDFDILSSFGQKYNPAWEGKWQNTRFVPTQLLTGTFNGVTRAFCFGTDPSFQNCLYELSKKDNDDWGGEHIPWEFTTRAFDFGKLSKESTPFTENELYDGDLWLREIIE